MASDKKHSFFWPTTPLVPYSPDELKKRCGSLQNFAKKTMVHETPLFATAVIHLLMATNPMFYTIKIMFLDQISILLPVGRSTPTPCMEYEAGHFDICHNTIEELWVFTNFDPAFQPSISIHVSTTTISWLLKRPTHVTKWLFLQTVCSSHTNELFIHFFMHTLLHVIYFQPRRPQMVRKQGEMSICQIKIPNSFCSLHVAQAFPTSCHMGRASLLRNFCQISRSCLRNSQVAWWVMVLVYGLYRLYTYDSWLKLALVRRWGCGGVWCTYM